MVRAETQNFKFKIFILLPILLPLQLCCPGRPHHSPPPHPPQPHPLSLSTHVYVRTTYFSLNLLETSRVV